MKIIAIEGLDKSGKHTTVKGLKEKLTLDGYKVEASEFHRYDTETGQLIRKWLYGEFPVDQKTIELIMAADKYAQLQFFEELKQKETDILLLDRYIGSQYVYSRAAGVDEKWIEELLRYVPIPDMEILVDVSAQTSMERKGKHGENDRYESDYKLLSQARDLYLQRRPYHTYEGARRGLTKFGIVSGECSPELSIEQAYKLITKYLMKYSVHS